MILTSKELKRQARKALNGKYPAAASLTASVLFASLALSLLLELSGVGSSPKRMHQFFFWALWIIMSLLDALLEIGLFRLLFGFCHPKAKAPRGVLFYAFQNQPDTFILTSAFRYLVTLIWFAPALWKYMTFPQPNTYEELFSTLLFIAALAMLALIPAILCALPFCLSDYVLFDHPYATAREALTASFQLTRGHRFQILRLWISFLPVVFLCITTFGAGLLWVKPYFHATMTQLYLNLSGQKEPEEPETEEHPEMEYEAETEAN